MMKILRQALGIATLLLSGLFSPSAFATLLSFEEQTDGTLIVNQYADIVFANAIVLASGQSLNNLDFPPHSGSNVLGDTGGPISINFLKPIDSFSGYFTYATQLTFSLFDVNSGLLSSFTSSGFENYLSSGNTPNELITGSSQAGISRIVISGDIAGSSFVVDDLSFSFANGDNTPPDNQVPEPGTILLMLLGFASAVFTKSLRRIDQPKRVSKACVLSLLLVSGSAFAQMKAPILDPANVNMSSPTKIFITAKIELENLLPGSVNVQQVSATGSVIKVLGTLNDDGLNGDEEAGDKIYSGTLTFTPDSEGTAFLRVSAAQKGKILRTFSPSSQIGVLPAGMPINFRAPDVSQIVTDPATGAEIIGNEVIACFKPEVSPQSVAAIGATFQGTVGGKFDGDNCYQFFLAVSSASAVNSAIAYLISRSEVTSAEPDEVQELELLTSDPCLTAGVLPTCTDTSYAMLHLDEAHALGATGKNAIIAILDSGLRLDNTDITSYPKRIKYRWNVTSNPGDSVVSDTEGHGSHVTGIIAAAAPDSKLFIIKTCVQKKCPTSNMRAGIDLAVKKRVNVINISSGGLAKKFTSGNIKIYETAIFMAFAQDILVVTSAGNEKTNAVHYPSGFVGALSVGAVDATTDLRASFSNFGNRVDLSAPGSVNQGGIRSNGITTGQTALKAGTSMAAPFVTGTAALLYSDLKMSSSNMVFDQLTGSTVPIAATSSGTPNQDMGAGRLDPVAALGAIRISHLGSTKNIPYSFTLLNANNQVIVSQSDQLGPLQAACELRVSNYCLKDYSTYKLLAPGAYSLSIRIPASTSSFDSFRFFFSLKSTEANLTFTGVRNNGSGTISADKKSATGDLSNVGFSVRVITFDLIKK